MRRSNTSIAKPSTEWKLITPGTHQHPWDTNSEQTAPSPRQGHSTTSFSRRGAFFIFGGKCAVSQLDQTAFNAAGSREGTRDGKTFHFNDCYRFDCKTKIWTPLTCSGEPPPARAHHCAVAVDNTRLVVMGGTNGRIRFNDMYRLNTGTLVWEQVVVPSLSMYQIRSASVFQDQIIIFGTLANPPPDDKSGNRNSNHASSPLLTHCCVDLGLSKLMHASSTSTST